MQQNYIVDASLRPEIYLIDLILLFYLISISHNFIFALSISHFLFSDKNRNRAIVCNKNNRLKLSNNFGSG